MNIYAQAPEVMNGVGRHMTNWSGTLGLLGSILAGLIFVFILLVTGVAVVALWRMAKAQTALAESVKDLAEEFKRRSQNPS